MDAMYPPFGGEPEPHLSTVDALIDELELQAALLIAVATDGGVDVRDKRAQRQYRDRRRRLVNALDERGLAYPFTWQDLSQWHGHWRAKGLRTYHQREVTIQELVDPTIEALEQQGSSLQVSDPGSGPLEWADLDARLDDLRDELNGAISRDDLQDVGRRSREILIECAQLLADPSLVPDGEASPKDADAKAWLNLFLTAYASGSHRDELRRFIRATWELAQTVTHGDIDRVEAFAAAQATVLIVRTLQALAAEDPAVAPPP
jgi:hypothetical protein